MKQKFDIITSTCVPLPLENVDTDQIIPARFLKATTRDEKFFGDNLFRDWRYNPDGSLNLKTVVLYTTELLCKHGLRNTADIQQVAGVWVYPKEYFNPMQVAHRLNITANTRSIHHYAGSWVSARLKFKSRVARLLGSRLTVFLIKLKRSCIHSGK